MRTQTCSATSTSGTIATWFESRGTYHRLERDAASSVRSGRLLYLARSILQFDFAITDNGTCRKSTALMFEGEVVDLEALRFVPRGTVRALGQDAEYWISEMRDTAETRLPPEVLDRLGRFTGRLARQTITNATLDIEERLCTLLVKFAVRLGVRANDCVHFDLPMSRDAMATVLGVRSESLSRAISQAKSSGLIGLDGRSHVTVRDWSALCAKSPISDLVIAANA